MITIIDRNDTHFVQKCVRPKKPPMYLVTPKDAVGDASRITALSSLVEARRMIGKSQGGKLIASSNG